MSEFKAIETQEEFDKMIGERIRREKETVEKQYEGYLSPEAAAKKYEGYLSPEDVTKKYEGYISPEEAAKKDAKIKGYETDSVKMRIAHETGLPYEMAARLSGEDEKSIKADAEALLKVMGRQKQQVPPMRQENVKGTDQTTAGLMALAKSMKGE